MKVDRKKLISAIKIASLGIERATIPVLETLGAEIRGPHLVLHGTNLDHQITVSIERDNAGEGAASARMGCLQAPRSIARMLEVGEQHVDISIATSDKETTALALTSGPLDIAVTNLPFEDFPLMRCGDPITWIEISTEILDEMLRASRALSTEETRYYLNGLYLHVEDDPSTLSPKSLMAVSTDGHRLYRARITHDKIEALEKALPSNMSGGGLRGQGTGEPRGVIIPKQVIKILRSLRDKISGTITLSVQPEHTENQPRDLAPATSRTRISFAFITKDGIEVDITTKVIDGAFPAYSRVIPTGDQDKRILVSRADLARAVRAISAASSGISRTPSIKLTFDPKGGRLCVASATPDKIRSATTWIPAETSVKEPFSIGFNGNYLRDLCEVAKGDSLILATQDGSAPTIITSPEESDFLTVLMPMRV